MKTLYLHVGTHKTATTTIQRFLEINSGILSEKGCAFPIFPFHYPQRAQNRNGMFLTWPVMDKNDNVDKEATKNRFQEALNQIHELFQTHDSVVLTDEIMWRNLFSKKGVLKRLVKDGKEYGYTVRIIIYLRRQDQFVESMWSQRIKMDEKMRQSLDEYISIQKHLDYSKILSFYGDTLGDENVIVRRFSDGVKAEGGILADFMQQIGLNLTDEYAIPEDGVLNRGLYGNTIRIMQLVNDIEGLTRQEHWLFRRSLTMCSPDAKRAYPCSEFTDEERAEFMKPFAEGNQMIAERFIKDGKPLFSDNYAGLPKRENNNPAMDDDIIRAMVSTSLLLYRYNRKLEHKNKELEKRMQALEKQVEKHERRLEYLRHPMKFFSRKNHS